MKANNKKLILFAALLILAALVAFSCKQVIKQEKPFEVVVDVNVRIDIYQHASDVLDYISGESDTIPVIEGDTETETSSFIDGALDIIFGVKTACAAEKTRMSRYRALVESMKKRAGKINRYKADSSIGENHEGLLSARNTDKMKSDAKYAGAVKKLVRDENRDRKEFYQIDAKLHNKPYREIEKTFAKARRNKAKPGQWIEVKKDGKWIWTKKK